jgi:hypothetical protein
MLREPDPPFGAGPGVVRRVLLHGDAAPTVEYRGMAVQDLDHRDPPSGLRRASCKQWEAVQHEGRKSKSGRA